MFRPRVRERIVTLPFVALFVVAVLLRVIRLDETPGIYPDEASHLEVAYSLLRGDFAAGLFTSTFLPRLPLPLVLINLAAAAVGWNLYAIRACTVTAALLALIVMYRLLRRDPHNGFLFLPLLVFAVYPPAIYFNRWGFTYNFLAPAFLYVLYQGVQYSKNSRASDLYKMLLGIAAALLSEPLGIVALIYGLAICSVRSWSATWKVLWMSLAPVGAYLALLYGLSPDVLSSDIHGLLQTRIPGSPSRMPAVFISLQVLFKYFGWLFVLGLVGLWFVPRDVRRHTLLFVAIYLLVSARVAGGDGSLVIRQFIAFIPFQCLGIGCLLAFVALRVESALDGLMKACTSFGARIRPAIQRAHDRLRWFPAALVRGGLASVFLVASYPSALTVWSGQFRTPFDRLTAPDVDSMYQAVEFLNARCDESDWVLAQCLPQRLNCRTGTLSQMAVIEGSKGNPFYPHEIYKDRRVEAVTLGDIRYVVISTFTRRVEARYAGVRSLLEQTRHWPVVFEREGVIIREGAGHTGRERSGGCETLSDLRASVGSRTPAHRESAGSSGRERDPAEHGHAISHCHQPGTHEPDDDLLRARTHRNCHERRLGAQNLPG
jgi:hypothetical protein